MMHLISLNQSKRKRDLQMRKILLSNRLYALPLNTRDDRKPRLSITCRVTCHALGFFMLMQQCSNSDNLFLIIFQLCQIANARDLGAIS